MNSEDNKDNIIWFLLGIGLSTIIFLLFIEVPIFKEVSTIKVDLMKKMGARIITFYYNW